MNEPPQLIPRNFAIIWKSTSRSFCFLYLSCFPPVVIATESLLPTRKLSLSVCCSFGWRTLSRYALPIAGMKYQYRGNWKMMLSNDDKTFYSSNTCSSVGFIEKVLSDISLTVTSGNCDAYLSRNAFLTDFYGSGWKYRINVIWLVL